MPGLDGAGGQVKREHGHGTSAHSWLLQVAQEPVGAGRHYRDVGLPRVEAVPVMGQHQVFHLPAKLAQPCHESVGRRLDHTGVLRPWTVSSGARISST